MIYKKYTDELDSIEFMEGFFEGWPNPPDKETHRKILKNSFFL